MSKTEVPSLIYTHPNGIMVGLVRSYLESHDIRCDLKNEILSGGMGELAPIDCWQELHVSRVADRERAAQLVKVFREQQGDTDRKEHQKGQGPGDWLCRYCSELNGKNFELCWQCGRDSFSSYEQYD